MVPKLTVQNRGKMFMAITNMSHFFLVFIQSSSLNQLTPTLKMLLYHVRRIYFIWIFCLAYARWNRLKLLKGEQTNFDSLCPGGKWCLGYQIVKKILSFKSSFVWTELLDFKGYYQGLANDCLLWCSFSYRNMERLVYKLHLSQRKLRDSR